MRPTLLGYPPRGWWNHETLTSGYFYNVADLVPRWIRPTWTDFWSEPGYLGAGSELVDPGRASPFETTVAPVLDSFPCRWSWRALLTGISRRPSRHRQRRQCRPQCPVAWAEGNTVGFAYSTNPAVIHGMVPGDQLRIDNSWPLALETYQRHQVPTADMYGWDQFRGPDGDPMYPQRDLLVGLNATVNTVGSMPAGRITAKTLVLEVLMDIDALPWQADWYRSKVKEALGPKFEDQFAIWYVDHAQHDNPATTAAHAHCVSYGGALQQGLRDLSAWVESGVRPPDTTYDVVDTQVLVPATAAERRGIQPVVELTVNGGVRAEVDAGEPVTFEAVVEVPPHAGDVVAAEWDFEGTGIYPVTADVGSPNPKVALSATHAYAEPGTYFAVLRGTSQRQGDPRTPYGRVQNLARVRVVVR